MRSRCAIVPIDNRGGLSMRTWFGLGKLTAIEQAHKDKAERVYVAAAKIHVSADLGKENLLRIFNRVNEMHPWTDIIYIDRGEDFKEPERVQRFPNGEIDYVVILAHRVYSEEKSSQFILEKDGDGRLIADNLFALRRGQLLAFENYIENLCRKFAEVEQCHVSWVQPEVSFTRTMDYVSTEKMRKVSA
jgi:hypothetical protein